MSLYEYAVAVSDEDAATYVQGVKAIRRTGIFGSCGCTYRPYTPCKGHAIFSNLGEQYHLYDEAVSQLLSRPMTGEGESAFSKLLEVLGLDYDQPLRLNENIGNLLLAAQTLTPEQEQWVRKNSGKQIIKANDNEWG